MKVKKTAVEVLHSREAGLKEFYSTWAQDTKCPCGAILQIIIEDFEGITGYFFPEAWFTCPECHKLCTQYCNEDMRDYLLLTGKSDILLFARIANWFRR